MWTEQRRMTRYRVVLCNRVRGSNVRYCVQRKKWYWPLWHRCSGLQPLFDIFETVELAKQAIPHYDRCSAYWVGTMVDLTKERLGINE